MEKRFEGKVALITGGASGMGLLSGKCLLAEGAKVALVDVNGEALAAATAGMDEARVLRLTTDVRDFEQVKAAVAETVRVFGTIDILINMAGGSSWRILHSHEEFCDQPIEVIDWGLDVNLKGPVYFCHEVSRVMREHHTGVIVNIGSVSGTEGARSSPDYAIAKSGIMNGLTRSMAIFGAKYGFRCVCVSPGPVLTRPDMAKIRTLLGRAAEPQEVVDFILYLASDKGAFLTGENYPIDGGRQLLRG